MAKARLALATRNESALTNYQAARCDYSIAATLAQRANDSTRISEANAGRAEALIGLRTADPGRAADYDVELEGMHRMSGAQASRAVHMAVAQMLVARSDVSGAMGEATSHLQGRDRALTLISVAQLQRRQNQSNDVVRRTLTDAYNADRTSTATNSALGSAYFEMGDSPTAEPYLLAATRTTPEAGDESMRNQAYYYLSVIEANRRNFTRAGEYADLAGNDIRALTQSCLVRILMGGEQVFAPERDSQGRFVRRQDNPPRNFVIERNAEAAQRCNRLGSSTEGQLLMGLYQLRRAQYLPAPTLGTADERTYRDTLDAANNAFRAQSDTTTALTWPAPSRLPNEAAPTLRQMLDYGSQLTRYFDGFCRGSSPASAANANVAAVYSYYGITRCVPSNQ